MRLNRDKVPQKPAPDRDATNVSLKQERESEVLFMGSTLGQLPLPPSTKVVAAMGIIQTWLEEAPDDKILGNNKLNGTSGGSTN